MKPLYIRGFAMGALQSPCKAPIESVFSMGLGEAPVKLL